MARAALETLLRDGSLGRVFLIRDGWDAVGYVVLAFGLSLEFGGRDAFIDEFFIRESNREGRGTATLKFLEETCRALDIRALHFEWSAGTPRRAASTRQPASRSTSPI